MLFYKKILLLKEVVCGFSVSSSPVGGILRLEQEDGVSSVGLTLVNVSQRNGEYRLFVCFDKRTAYSFQLGKRPFSFTDKNDFFPSIESGLSAGLVFIKDNVPTVVAFARTENSSLTLKDFKKAVTDKCIKESEADEYNDEVVATENYFTDTDLKEKLETIKGIDTGYVQNKNALPDSLGKNAQKENETNARRSENETSSAAIEKYSEEFPYFLTVKKDLDETFLKYPPEERLNALTPNGKWVKIGYGKNKFYVVGILKENCREKFICYGVPSKYSDTPPKELSGFASFVPLSVFNLKGDGFFMMFQDAVTGKSVKPD